MEFNFNGVSAEESKNGIRLDVNASVFGDSNKQNVHNLRARVCGNEELIEDEKNSYAFFSLNMKIKEDFEDVHGMCEKVNQFFVKNAPFKGSVKLTFADNYLFVRGYKCIYRDLRKLDGAAGLLNQTTD
jgi:hypothetical protein